MTASVGPVTPAFIPVLIAIVESAASAFSRTRTCTVCGEKETETVSKSTAHQFGNWVVTKEATCTKGGKEKSVCKGRRFFNE